MKTILVGYDDTEPSKRALERAAELAQAFGSTIYVTSVAPTLVPAVRGMGAIDPVDSPAKHADELDRAKAYLATRNLDAKLVTAVGDPADAIVEAAESCGADLIVVGTREPGFFERLISGSVSQAVSRQAHTDVLIVH